MKTLLTTVVLFFTIAINAQTLQVNKDAFITRPLVPYKLVNSPTAVYIGLGCSVIAGGLQNMHTIYMLEPHYLTEKFGWKDPRDNQNVNLNNGGNSVFSFMKNPDHALQAGTTFFACAGATALTVNYYFTGGFHLKGQNTFQKIAYIVAPLVAARTAMGIGGQIANLGIKGRLDPL